jgi:hypothetical protein
MFADQRKDADWAPDIICDRNGYRAHPEGIGCIAMNARRPGPVWVKGVVLT